MIIDFDEAQLCTRIFLHSFHTEQQFSWILSYDNKSLISLLNYYGNFYKWNELELGIYECFRDEKTKSHKTINCDYQESFGFNIQVTFSLWRSILLLSNYLSGKWNEWPDEIIYFWAWLCQLWWCLARFYNIKAKIRIDFEMHALVNLLGYS